MDKRSLQLNHLVVEMLSKHVDSWLFQGSSDSTYFSSLVFIKILRLIEEHYVAELLQLRAKEVRICLKIWANQKEECYLIGAEFTRIFFNVVKIPEFKPICNDLAKIHDGKPLSMHLFEKRNA